VFVVAAASLALADQGGHRFFREFLNGFKEAATVVSTTGTGTFRAAINRDETEIRYVLTFRDLEGNVEQAHIHIGHPQNQGGVVLWLCDSAARPAPAGTDPPPCSHDPLNATSGMVSGTLTAADVRDLPTNGIAGATPATPGEFEEVIALMRAGLTYVNVHSSTFTGGEIRSQLDNRTDDRDDHGHRHDDD
jgi:hypothetical protein